MTMIKENFRTPECRSCKECILSVKRDHVTRDLLIECKLEKECKRREEQKNA